MNPIRKSIVLDNINYYRKHLAILQVITGVKLPPKEAEVLAQFMSLPDAMVEDNRFNTLARKHVKTKLGISDAGLSNYLRSLLENKFILKSEITGIIKLNPIIQAVPNNQGYMFKITKDGTDK